MTGPARRGPGRRPGESGTREAILAAARRRFASVGYDRATIRSIASDAGVDPALVHHFFGTKQALFQASVSLPFSPGDVLPTLLADSMDTVGHRLVRLFVSTWDEAHDRSPIMALLRSAVADEAAARLTREFIAEEILGPVAAALGGDDAPLRASLAATQMVGLALARYVVGVEPLASADVDLLVAAVGPTVQRYLTGDLGSAEVAGD